MSEDDLLPVVTPPSTRRLPPWLRVNLPAGIAQAKFNHTSGSVHENRLHTVCEEARCPNIHDCWSRGTATFMVAGKECTRGCRFCSVETLRSPPPLEADEPESLADAAVAMGLEHIVITVVNRDDLADGGAAHFRDCIEAVHRRMPATTIELLSSDLDGNLEALGNLVLADGLEVFAHNVECVPRLDATVRDPRASFSQSLQILKIAKKLRPSLMTKSSLMVGVGETNEEIDESLPKLRQADIDMVTLGQYLAPGVSGTRFLPVDRYVPPEQFARWEELAYELGFRAVAAGPLVRSSYRAGALLARAQQYQDSNQPRDLG